MLKTTVFCQALYYGITGVWPLVSIETFEFVTGPKTDRWLVYMVGLLAFIIGLSLFVGVRGQSISVETMIMSVSAAAAFAAIDLTFVLRGTISKVYLVDAALESLVIVLVASAAIRLRKGEP